MKKLSLFLISLLTMVTAMAQDINVSGTVMSASDDEPVIGASVVVKGNAAIGVATDLDGNFAMKVPKGSTLLINSIGFKAQEVTASTEGQKFNVVLEEDSQVLDDVVVVGYGVQRKSVVTASISKIDNEKLAATAPVRVDAALKGLASGVTVTSSSGQPGASSRVRIRGIGTINNSDPLYIVDGMPIEGNIDYLNPQDIESIEVLKDAASGAVYGARAANGVILVTTKNGKVGKTNVTYDFSYGWQSASKKRKVLNATEYAILMNEGSLNSGVDAIYADPYSYGEGFDWQDAVFYDNAPVMNHQVSISGASEKVNYFLSFGFYEQDGIVGGNYGKSNYQRMTLRSNTLYTIFDESKNRSFLNNLKVTVNASYARIKSTGVETNSTWGSPLGSALSLSPMLTPYCDDAQYATQSAFFAGNSNYVEQRDGQGRVFLVPEAFGNYQEMANPIAGLARAGGSKDYRHKFVGNFIGELQIWDNIKYRISYGADLSFEGNNGYTLPYFNRAGSYQSYSSVWASKSNGLVWQLENTLSYNKRINEHEFSILLGQSAKESRSDYLGASANDIRDYNRPYLDATNGLAENGDRNGWGAPNPKAKLASLFARVGYNYDSRYMFEATVRRDGSSRFGSSNHWATFPSLSLGWNLHNEPYIKPYLPSWYTSTKVRFSWGKNGNENIGDFRYIALASSGNNYIFGRDENVITGVKASILPNKTLKWEESKQTNVGIDFGFLDNSLTLSVDYFKKNTDGMLMNMSIPAYVGESVPVGNVGKMENQGVEIEANFNRNFGDFRFNVGGNVSYLKNKLIEYGNEEGYANDDNFQGTGVISRAQNGLPFPFFYGFKTAGIIQNQAEADEYNAKYSGGFFPDAVPGDVRFVDTNGDGAITEDDRTNIGNGNPDWTYGFNLGVEWKGISLQAFFQGTIGNDIFDATRRTDALASNLPAWMLGRWTGEGSSNRIPRYVRADNRNWQSSDLLVYDGSYFRMTNIILGYTLPQNITRKVGVESFRVYGSCENLFTCTKYHGFDPEISSGGTSLGIDYGVYPQPRTWTVGFNIQF